MRDIEYTRTHAAGVIVYRVHATPSPLPRKDHIVIQFSKP